MGTCNMLLKIICSIKAFTTFQTCICFTCFMFTYNVAFEFIPGTEDILTLWAGESFRQSMKASFMSLQLFFIDEIIVTLRTGVLAFPILPIYVTQFIQGYYGTWFVHFFLFCLITQGQIVIHQFTKIHGHVFLYFILYCFL